MRPLPWFRLLLVTSVVAVLAGCSAPNRQRSQRISVTVAAVEKRAMPYALDATGTIEPLQSTAVGSQVGGTVVALGFREGQDVRAGQLLYQLDPRPFRSAVEAAAAALAKSRAQARAARLEAERAEKLFEQKVLSDAEWEQKRAAAETWLATVSGDSAALRNARLQLEYASIRAPISGRTGRTSVQKGDLVRAATVEPLVTINQTKPVRVRFTVPGTEVGTLQRRRGTPPRVIVRSTSGDSSSHEGPLVFVDNAVDETSGTLLLKGEFPNLDGRLVAGEFVNVRLVLDVEDEALVVPAVAVTTGQEGTFVYVMNADSTVTARPVTVSRMLDETAVLAAGLTVGETVITDGQMRLSPGAKVVVRGKPGAGGGAGDGGADAKRGARAGAGARPNASGSPR